MAELIAMEAEEGLKPAPWFKPTGVLDPKKHSKPVQEPLQSIAQPSKEEEHKPATFAELIAIEEELKAAS